MAAPCFALAPSNSQDLTATRQAGLTGIWHTNGEAALPEGRARTCQDAGGFIIISFVSPWACFHEYLIKPEKVTTACLLSIWHFCMSLLCVGVHGIFIL